MSEIRAFISYSKDSDEHCERVLKLSERLRTDGVETILDRYVNGAPPEGWPRWMINAIDTATHIVVVCSEAYYRSFRGLKSNDHKRGSLWEGAIVSQDLYAARTRSNIFIPVLFDASDVAYVPEVFREQTFYFLDSQEGYEQFCDVLLGQRGVEPRTVGVPKRRSLRTGRHDFSQATIQLLANRAGMRCSFPDCRLLTVGPDTSPLQVVNLGVACHITAASPGGPRYDPSLTGAERRSPENGVFLCQNHARIVDANPNRFPASLLRIWKAEAEAAASSKFNKTTPDLSLERLQELSESELLSLVVIPLLSRMGFANVCILSGPAERGKDLVAEREEFGLSKRYAVIVSKIRPKEKKGSSRTFIKMLLNQLTQALLEPIIRPATLESQPPDRLLFITPFQIPQTVLESVSSQLRQAQRAEINIIDGPTLLDQVLRYMPNVFRHEDAVPRSSQIAIKRLSLTNIKCFKAATFSFTDASGPRQWTAILGDNGVGKSTVLQCVALAALGPDVATKLLAIPDGLVRNDADEGIISATFEITRTDGDHAAVEISVDLVIQRGNREVSLGESTSVGNEYLTEFVNQRRRTDFQGWFVAGYGPFRSLFFTDEPQRRGTIDIARDRVESLFDPSKLLLDPSSVARLLVGDGSPFANFGAPPQLPIETTRSIRSTLERLVLPISLGDEGTGDILTVFGTIPIAQLSDGTRSMLGWASHLLVHLLAAVEWQSDIQRLSGIVLIDEIDVHLHPQWQRVLIAALTDAFPNLQFIVSSHAPMTVSTLDTTNGEVIVLQEREGDINVLTALPSIRGWRADQILASELFDYVITADPVAEAVLRRASVLSGKGNERTPEEEHTYQKLKSGLREILVEEGQTLIERELQGEYWQRTAARIQGLERELFGADD